MPELSHRGGAARIIDQLHIVASRVVSDPPRLPTQTPGLAVVVKRRDGTGARVFTGTDAAGRVLGEDTLFPIASATKLATGLAVLRLVDRGAIELDVSLARYLPDAQAARAGVTVRTLLSHTSGLPVEVAPDAIAYGPGLNWRVLAQACLETPLQTPPRSRVQYSNVAYGLLAQVIERLVDADFADALDSLVLAPLGIEAYIGREPPRPPAAIWEIESSHRGTDIEPANSLFWRGLALPWAGLVTTADGLLALLKVYADSRPDLLSPAVAAEARADQTAGLGGGFNTTDPFLGLNPLGPLTWPRCPWGLVVELRGDKRPHWTPPAASPSSFGQVGSSGCLAWCDPIHGVDWAILGTRETARGWLLRYGSAIGAAALL